jgi:hypothetical protein
MLCTRHHVVLQCDWLQPPEGIRPLHASDNSDSDSKKTTKAKKSPKPSSSSSNADNSTVQGTSETKDASSSEAKPESKQQLTMLFDSWQKFECSVCDRTLNGQHEWQQHLQSRKHRKAASYAKQSNNSAGKKRKRDQPDQPAVADDSSSELATDSNADTAS